MKNNKKPQEKPDRKTVERNRRIHMKALCLKLTSLIPRQHLKPSKNMLWQPDQLDLATNYIKQLKERVEVLKSRKKLLAACDVETDSGGGEGNSTTFGTRFPRFEFRDFGSGLEVVLVTGMSKQIMLYEIISILKEEGAEVMSANVSRVDDKAYYTLHAQVRISRVGVDTSRVCERLQQLIS